MDQVKNVNVLNFDEFDVKRVFLKIKYNVDFMSYIPELRTGTSIDRKYFYDRLITLCPDYVANMIKNAYIKRARRNSKPEEETIQITPHLLSGIRKSSYISSKSNLVFIINRV